ncbi:MAG TPA: redoxin domain-containing protein [Candidatus Acidoferrales bacterium]|nr:redoxin domain-containing protein [Candidatus Acidoferrales bacterium]
MRLRAALYIIPTILLAGVVLSLNAQAPSATHHASANRATTSKPADLPLIDLDGYKKILATYKGKPLLVTFWATWCEPCRYEYPTIVELAKEYKPKGLAVVGVSFDNNADMHLVRDFLAKNKPDFPNYRQNPDIDVDAFYVGVRPEWTGTMPETLFYARDGRIVGHYEGEQTRADFAKAIEATLAAH